ncbi:hypothetical protein EXU85_04420 [Spirosoma sp. KCTC 42546]|uniref:hypothetical protein n=1 Tax=Spirosoma sp. KCTC 42546 TaxID=2520506 RepID=UPI00115BD9AE|nr:hypothetical protein [Spirosoma sp. KCTC 42546]QDK77873.1 hypothetical protein EXU85_04420 [Spirosoma sp. KCTC 42546]
MRVLKINTLFAFVLVPLLILAYTSVGQIRYFRTPASTLKPDTKLAFMAVSEDSIANDTLFQIRSKEGYPMAYFRKIRTSVCFDNKCRLLKVNLYWTSTGRYLGFDLPKGEFLSKAEHKPFTPAEYERMSDLLADPLSPLATLSYAELAPHVKLPDKGNEVDGVSSATAKNVLEYVVEGAAYTTYKMWHVVYGSTQADVTRLTEKSLSPDFILTILESPDLTDKIWALNHIRGFVPLTPALQNSLLGFISPTDYNLAERAIQAFGAGDLQSNAIQQALFTKFNKSGYALKKLIVGKFKEAPVLDEQVKKTFAESLTSLNSELISNVLDLFRKHKVTDADTCRLVAQLLTNRNELIAQKAFAYLNATPVRDTLIEMQMKAYKLKK